MSPKVCHVWTFHINGIIQYVISHVCRLSSNLIFSWFMHVIEVFNQYFIPFYSQIGFYCMDKPHFVYVFISWQTFGLFPLFVNDSAISICVHFCVDICFQSLEYIHGVELLGLLVRPLWGNAKLFSKWLYNFTLLPAMCKSSGFSTSSPVLVIDRLFITGIPIDVKWYLNYGFDLHFSKE